MNLKNSRIKKRFLFADYYERLKAISMTIFKWDGLPETCNERFLEKCLFHYGKAIFIEDEEMSFLNLKVAPSGTLNVYDEPVKFRAFSNTYSKDFNADNCVYIRNNYLARPTEETIIIYAERLANLEMAINVNINAQKTPILIRCDEKTRLTLEKIYRNYEGDSPVIFGHKSLQEKPLEVLLTGAPFVTDKLREEKRAVWNEVLEFLGLNTNPSDKKKERLITDEVKANNEQIEIMTNSMLVTRQKACEEINKLYGLNVSVHRNLEESGDFNHGEIYN